MFLLLAWPKTNRGISALALVAHWSAAFNFIVVVVAAVLIKFRNANVEENIL